jgi:predicted CoA-substrate-specific enzyme activase
VGYLSTPGMTKRLLTLPELDSAKAICTNRLGLDFGSSAVKAVLIDEGGVLCFQGVTPCDRSPLLALRGLVERLIDEQPLATTVSVALSGRSRGLVMPYLRAFSEVSEIVAAATGAYHNQPGTRDLLSLGGQYSLWCRLDPDHSGNFNDFALSDLCAAGAGSFLEQQAERLALSIDELAQAAAQAKRAPIVAGRCTVFTKSDIIHLQQKGTPVDEIALGLCHALVRTFQAQVMHGRQLEAPVLLIGGCAKNRGMVRAVQEVFTIGTEALTVAELPELVSAVGTALLADAPPIELSALLRALRGAESRAASWTTVARLPVPLGFVRAVEPRGEELSDQKVILGVDVGSVSTNLALVDLQGRLLDSAYVRTSGRPLEAVKEALTSIVRRHARPINVVGASATGSGRHLVSHWLGTDLVKNEISAQLRAAVAFLPEVDTVLEIGGQDAKYIRAEQGTLSEFAMNRICAAGTGSFLEEQADKLGVSITDEFAERAMAAEAPVELGCRCTVFMESEAVAAMAAGARIDDVVAGLALSVARNFLERVVGGRRVGEKIVLQGGTAANRAVVAALEQLLGRPVLVHPHHRVSGALGIALLVLDAIRKGRTMPASHFRGFSLPTGKFERSFECSSCSAHCQVTQFRTDDAVFHFGDVCERYTSRDHDRAQVPDPLGRRFELLLTASQMQESPSQVPPDALGLPRASHTFALLPWLAALARAANRTPLLSGPTTTNTLAAGMRHLTSNSCLPIKAAYGHAAELVKRGVTQLLMPSLGTFQGDEGLAHSCLYGHHLPWMVARAVPGAQVIAPEISLDLPRGRRVDELAEAGTVLQLSRRDVERALDEGDAGARHLRRDLEAWGREVLAAGHDRIAVVFGRPYLLCDPLLNMALGRHLARHGLPVLPLDALPLESVSLDQRWNDLPWHYSRDLIRAARLVQRDERLFPVVVSSFGCGPDAFTLKHLERLFAGRPHLMLELDEHRSEAGLVTRIEAFNDEIAAHIEQGRTAKSVSRAPLPKLTKRGHLVMPYFADHAYGQAGILRAAGFDVTLLPPPSRATRQRGEALSSGRECHPFAIVAGDLATCVECGTIGPDSVFCLPGTVVSCLLRQYGDGLDLMLERLGVGRVRLVTLSLDSLPRLVGLPLMIRLGAVLSAIDMLLRARCRIRPYELYPGQTDELYQRSLERVGFAAERGNLWDILPECAAAFAAIKRRQAARPLVGVAGDVYTRINDFASDDLFRSLENAGCEVWPAPYANEVAEYNATRRKQLAWRLRRPGWGLRFGMTVRVMAQQRQRIERLFSAIHGIRPEISVTEMQALVRPYLGVAANPLLVLNIGRMLMYAAAGVDGILNASCINCMVGSASEALQERLRRDIGQIPVATLIYGGSDGAANRTRLLAFVHQVRQALRDKNTGA